MYYLKWWKEALAQEAVRNFIMRAAGEASWLASIVKWKYNDEY